MFAPMTAASGKEEVYGSVSPRQDEECDFKVACTTDDYEQITADCQSPLAG
jgi:hypothetical protein